jgi:hypothetical protein
MREITGNRDTAHFYVQTYDASVPDLPGKGPLQRSARPAAPKRSPS